MELLVHISAPSSRRDDDRYTLQARNYLAYITGLRQGNDDVASKTVNTVEEAAIDADRVKRGDEFTTQTQSQLADDRSNNDNTNPNDASSRDGDSTRHIALLQARAPSFPFPDSAESSHIPPVKDNDLYSFASVSSVFTSTPSGLGLQTQSRKRSFSEFASVTSSEPTAKPSQRRRLSYHSSLAPKTPSIQTQDDYMNGDTTDIALAIAEMEERKAPGQAKPIQENESIEGDEKEYGKTQDLQRTSQRTESLLGSSPCDGRETDCETIRSEKNVVEKGILLVTPNLPRYLSAPIVQDKSTGKRSIPSGLGPAMKKSPASAERFFSASSAVSYNPKSASKSSKVPPKSDASPPTKSGSRRQSPASSQAFAPLRPLSSLPLMHTPARPSKASSISTSGDKHETYVTSALKYLISNPLLLKHYNCSTIPPASSSHSSSSSFTRKKSKISTASRKHQTRPLRPSERGHWSLDPSPWPPALQSEFWTYLGRIIRLGRVGWGVWCVRAGKFDDDNDHDSHDNCSSNSTATTAAINTNTSTPPSHLLPPSSLSSSSLGPIKIFCWGEIVPHIYLLLYVASRRALRTVEASWVDARNEVVVRIGPSLMY